MTQRRIVDTTLHVSKEGAENGTRLVPAETVLVVVRGMSLATEFRVALTHREVTFNQDLKAIRPKRELNNHFLFYYLLAERHKIRDSATEASHGTKKLEMKVLEDWPILLPPLKVQAEIADILAAYDDLIDNNRRRMALLEESARLLYREWFVHLRFPGHEHTPLTDGVPQGWKRTTVGAESSFISRGITPKYNDEAEGLVINQKCIRDGMLSLSLARSQCKKVPELKRVQKGDVLVNSTGEGTLGRVAQLWTEIENCTVDSHVTIVRPKDSVPRALFGRCLLSLEGYLSQMGRGATNQTELSKETIADIPFLSAPSSLAAKFEDKAESVIEQIVNLSAQNTALAQARDLLLPRLMNGEIEV
jgi:type I restriction enzyme S subunit